MACRRLFDTVIKTFRIPALLGLLATCTNCSTMTTADFEARQPAFQPIDFFTGETASRGVRENRKGTPVEEVFTATKGQMSGGNLLLEQDLRFEKEGETKESHRSWVLRKTGPHSYEGTANDVIGTIHGEARGNTFHWSFILEISPGNPLSRIRMSQWMYLQPDGATMVNHTTISWAGIVLGQVTEQFRKQR